MRKPIIAGNWKLNKAISEAVELVNGIKERVAGVDIDVIVGPVFTALSEVKKNIEGSNIQLSAQDVYWEEGGAFTGEVAPGMLKDVGCDYTIIGHSERRQYFNETNETVNKKIRASLKAGLKIMMCIGEKLEEREAGNTFDVVKDHLSGGLQDIAAENVKESIVIAYEPVWAIGTGKTATPDQAQEVHRFIRGLLTEIYDEDTSETVRIQYGGSVKPENIKDLISMPDIDGGLIGGASLKADSFSQIVNTADKIYKENN